MPSPSAWRSSLVQRRDPDLILADPVLGQRSDLAPAEREPDQPFCAATLEWQSFRIAVTSVTPLSVRDRTPQPRSGLPFRSHP